VNQVERHLLLQQPNLMETCKQMNMVVGAYSPLVPLTHPLAHTHPMHPAPVMAAAQAIGDAHGGKSTAAVLLAWSRQSGCVTVR
jgi:diketogulonate reductase-like aldo/keto reductase